ncbi:hypothetical protein C8J56DRAFT_1048404 [Mycena floridula]|nr:hypothetical protein C8J56DRAFT_1048404 [Mycena floridula]
MDNSSFDAHVPTKPTELLTLSTFQRKYVSFKIIHNQYLELEHPQTFKHSKRMIHYALPLLQTGFPKNTPKASLASLLSSSVLASIARRLYPFEQISDTLAAQVFLAFRLFNTADDNEGRRRWIFTMKKTPKSSTICRVSFSYKLLVLPEIVPTGALRVLNPLGAWYTNIALRWRLDFLPSHRTPMMSPIIFPSDDLAED